MLGVISQTQGKEGKVSVLEPAPALYKMASCKNSANFIYHSIAIFLAQGKVFSTLSEAGNEKKKKEKKKRGLAFNSMSQKAVPPKAHHYISRVVLADGFN
jgi:hypothetical protein